MAPRGRGESSQTILDPKYGIPLEKDFQQLCLALTVVSGSRFFLIWLLKKHNPGRIAHWFWLDSLGLPIKKLDLWYLLICWVVPLPNSGKSRFSLGSRIPHSKCKNHDGDTYWKGKATEYRWSIICLKSPGDPNLNLHLPLGNPGSGGGTAWTSSKAASHCHVKELQTRQTPVAPVQVLEELTWHNGEGWYSAKEVKFPLVKFNIDTQHDATFEAGVPEIRFPNHHLLVSICQMFRSPFQLQGFLTRISSWYIFEKGCKGVSRQQFRMTRTKKDLLRDYQTPWSLSTVDGKKIR